MHKGRLTLFVPKSLGTQLGVEELWPGTGAEDQNYRFSVCHSLTLDVRRNRFNMRNVF